VGTYLELGILPGVPFFLIKTFIIDIISFKSVLSNQIISTVLVFSNTLTQIFHSSLVVMNSLHHSYLFVLKTKSLTNTKVEHVYISFLHKSRTIFTNTINVLNSELIRYYGYGLCTKQNRVLSQKYGIVYTEYNIAYTHKYNSRISVNV